MYIYNSVLTVFFLYSTCHGAELAGSNPSCPGESVTFTCSITAPIHRWDIMVGSMSYDVRLTPLDTVMDAGPFQISVTSAMTGSVNETTATATSSPAIDGATLSCDPAGTAVVDPQTATAQVVDLSVTDVSATPQPSLKSVKVSARAQDSRTAVVCDGTMFNFDTAVVRGNCTVNNPRITNNANMFDVSELNLCRCRYTFTAFISTAFDDGAMSQPVPHGDPDFSCLIIYANVTPLFSNSAVLTLSESFADCVENYSITWGGVSFTASSGSTSLNDLPAVPVCDGSQITVTPNTGLGPVNSRRITWQLTALQRPSNLAVEETLLTWTNPNACTVDSISVSVGTGASEEACSNSYEQIMPSATSNHFPANSGPFYCVQFVIMDCIANTTFVVVAPLPAGASPVAIAVVVTFLVTLLTGLPLGMLVMYCIMRRRLQQHSYHTEPGTTTEPASTTAAAAAAPVYDVVGPGLEKFEMEGNTAYGPVRH